MLITSASARSCAVVALSLCRSVTAATPDGRPPQSSSACASERFWPPRISRFLRAATRRLPSDGGEADVGLMGEAPVAPGRGGSGDAGQPLACRSAVVVFSPPVQRARTNAALRDCTWNFTGARFRLGLRRRKRDVWMDWGCFAEALADKSNGQSQWGRAR